MKRCDSCGQYLPGDTKLACWRVKPARERRQIKGSPWNYYARWRCENCRMDRHGHLTWLQPTTLERVIALRGPGCTPAALPNDMEGTR